MVDMVDMTFLNMFLYTHLEEQIIVMTHSLAEVMDQFCYEYIFQNKYRVFKICDRNIVV